MPAENTGLKPPTVSAGYFAFVVALYVFLVAGMAALTVLRHVGY